jgi:soluble lytic murein transglycosylase-like protein
MLNLHFIHKPRQMKFAIAVSYTALLCALALNARADVYSYVSEDGITHFSDSPDDPRYALLLHVKQEAAQVNHTAPATARPFDREIAAVAKSSLVEAALLHAVISVESNYNPRAVSRKGAMGLMQLMPSTARAMGVTDPMDALQNIRGGARYLRSLLDRYADNKTLALAAYNAGPGAVPTQGSGIPQIAETRNYVPAVLHHYEKNLVALTSMQE